MDGYAVDAAHMMGVVSNDQDKATWNHKAFDLAESSVDPEARKWRGSLRNNIGWAHHARGEFDAALDHFERALIHREEEGKPQQGDIRIARWCIARCLRSLGRTDEALLLQWSLLNEIEQLDEPDGFVYEEIAECLHALHRDDEAKSYFIQAYELLSKYALLTESEPQRIQRLKTLAGP